MQHYLFIRSGQEVIRERHRLQGRLNMIRRPGCLDVGSISTLITHPTGVPCNPTQVIYIDLPSTRVLLTYRHVPTAEGNSAKSLPPNVSIGVV